MAGPKENLFQKTLSHLKPAVKEYMDRAKITQEELDKAKEAKNIEQRRIQEKQIRSLRNTYRPTGGFLGQNTLGGTGEGLPSKLG